MPRRDLSWVTILAYGAPGMAAALPVIPVAVLLPDWYARDLGLGFAVVGIALLVARLFDIVSDPIAGILVDRFAWRGWRYKGWLTLGAALAAPGLLLLAFPPQPASPLVLGLGAVALFTGWTLFMVPYTAWGAELSTDHHTRTLLTGARETAGLCGMLLAVAVPVIAATVPAAATGLAPLPLLALTALAVGAPALVILLVLVPEQALPRSGQRIRAADFVQLWRDAAFRRTLTCWTLNGFANGVPAVVFPVVISDLLRLDDAAMALLLLCYFGAGVAAMPLWVIAARSVGKVRAWRWAMLLASVVFMQVMWLDAGAAPLFVVICMLSGATLGADLALPPSIQADVMAADRARHQRVRTATAFALWSMATKLALALAVGAATLGLASLEGADGVVPRGELLVLYAGVPVAIKLAAWWLSGALVGRIGVGQTHAPAHEAQQAAE